MQTELFKRNALILLSDNVQQMLYKDILSANGFTVKEAGSADELVELINRDTHLVLVYVDTLDSSSIRLISSKIAELPSKITFAGLASNTKQVEVDNLKIIQLPLLIDQLLDQITETDEEESQGDETWASTM